MYRLLQVRCVETTYRWKTQTQHWNTLRHNSAPITIWPRLSLAHTYLASQLFSHAPCRATDDRWTSRSAQEKKRRINFMALWAVRLRCCLMTSCQSLDVLPTCRGIGGECVCAFWSETWRRNDWQLSSCQWNLASVSKKELFLIVSSTALNTRPQ